jgi:hypothetical protein
VPLTAQIKRVVNATASTTRTCCQNTTSVWRRHSDSTYVSTYVIIRVTRLAIFGQFGVHPAHAQGHLRKGPRAHHNHLAVRQPREQHWYVAITWRRGNHANNTVTLQPFGGETTTRTTPSRCNYLQSVHQLQLPNEFTRCNWSATTLVHKHPPPARFQRMLAFSACSLSVHARFQRMLAFSACSLSAHARFQRMLAFSACSLSVHARFQCMLAFSACSLSVHARFQ